MADPIRDELSVQTKRAVLVSVVLPDDPGGDADPLEELKGLVKTAGVQVVGQLMQKRQEVDPTLCIGRGKLDELRDLIEHSGAELVIFDNNLSPAQGRNLENELNKIIVDRSEIIMLTLETLGLNVPLIDLAKAEDLDALAALMASKMP